MVIYSCSKCLKEFTQKSHYNKHLTKKNPCIDMHNKLTNIIDKIITDKITNLVEKTENKLNNNPTTILTLTPTLIPAINSNLNMSKNKNKIKLPLEEPVNTPSIEEPKNKSKKNKIKLPLEGPVNVPPIEPLVIKTPISYIKPLIKWVGGKTQIIDKVMSEFPKEITNYHELFLGGGSILLGCLQNIEQNNIKLNGQIYAYDINETLINLYKNVQKKPKDIMSEINLIITEFNLINGNIVNRKPKDITEAKSSKESYYYWIRINFNKLTLIEKNSPLGTAYFIFLNKTCFRGVYREGPNGFNVPYGHYKNPEIINEGHLLDISRLIRNVNFIHSKFEESFKNILQSDFIYLDPPYAPVNETSFVGYTADGFTLGQHTNLFDLCKKNKFLMSNADVDLVKKNFKEKKYIIQIISCKRSINSKNPESKINEVLIKNY